MGLKRYFVEGEIPERFEMSGSEYNHLANVMRARAGQEVIVCNGDGTDCLCRVEEIGRKSVSLRVLSRARNLCEAEADVTAFVGLLKGDNTELEVQKLSELGIRRVVPFFSENTVAKADEKKIERFNRVALESAKQCGRAYVMKVERAIPFAEIFGREFDALIYLCEFEKERSLSDALAGVPKGSRVGFIVGSEGGFTRAEAELAERAGARTASLGRRLLRAETAAIAAGAVVRYALGEMEAAK